MVRLPLRNSQVSWRLNNDSVKKEDVQKENESKGLAMVAEDIAEDHSPLLKHVRSSVTQSIKMVVTDNKR